MIAVCAVSQGRCSRGSWLGRHGEPAEPIQPSCFRRDRFLAAGLRQPDGQSAHNGRVLPDAFGSSVDAERARNDR